VSVHRITVTTEDIKLGIQADPEHCPVALAVWRKIGPALVGADGVCMGRAGKGRKGELPRGVIRRIARYDNFGLMEPFEFWLQLG
jgi:hypothetical protein